MRRRGFITGIVAAAIIAPLTDFQSALESVRPAVLTLVDLATRIYPQTVTWRQLTDMLTESNEILEDLPWIDGTAEHVTVIRTRLPDWPIVTRGL